MNNPKEILDQIEQKCTTKRIARFYADTKNEVKRDNDHPFVPLDFRILYSIQNHKNFLFLDKKVDMVE